MKITFCLIFTLLFKIVVISQNADSLQIEKYYAKIEKYKYEPEKIDSSLMWADEMLKLAKTKYEKGLAYYSKAELVSASGWTYYGGKYSMDYIVKAVNLFAEIDNREYLSKSFNCLSTSFANFYNPDNLCYSKRVKYMNYNFLMQHNPNFKIELPFVEEFAEKEKEVTASELLKAIKITEDNLVFWRKRQSIPHEMYRTQLLAEYNWFLTKDFDKIEPLYLKAAKLARKLKNDSFYSLCMGTLCMYANLNRKYDKAIFYGEKGLSQALTLNNNFREGIFQDQLFIAKKAIGNFNEAYTHKERSIAIHEEIMLKSESKINGLMREKNTELNKRIEIESQLNAQKEKQTWYKLGLGILVFLITIGIFRNYQLTQKNKQISAAMLQGQTIERQRVASDLHDNLGSTLSSIGWSMEAIDKSKMTKKEQEVYQNLQTMINTAYGEVRLLSHNLLPEELEKQGLITALQTFVRKLNQNTKTNFELIFPDNFERLNKKTEFELYSICLELVNNILKHSQATEAKIHFKTTHNQLIMSILDNGKGVFENKSDGKGLKNVQARVDSLSGKWEMQNIEVKGVVNKITIKT
jgi:signal transduction histidine kinase